jgi:hypothetical protein
MQIRYKENSMLFNISTIGRGIYHVEGRTREDLALLFLRAQEYYENAHPDFYRQHFRVDTFKAWYANSFSNTGDFSYTWDWCGFNVPGEFVVEATHGAIDIGDVTKYDKLMLEVIEECSIQHEHFYLIGSMDEIPQLVQLGHTFTHELAHALYYLDADYRAKVNRIVSPVFNQIALTLVKYGYRTDVDILNDEAQAYLISGAEILGLDFDYRYYADSVRVVFDSRLKLIFQELI